MKNFYVNTIIIALLSIFAAVNLPAKEFRFKEDKSIFRNPGQGWLCFAPAMRPIEDSHVNYGAGYERFEWKDIQPEENKFDWERIDRCLRNFQKAGYPFYFRIMCANYHSKGRYSTPEWVFKKGAKGIEFGVLKTDVNYKADPNNPAWKQKRVAPIFDDEIWLAEHEKFIKAMAERYDGHPALGGIDLGSYGNWGEWHVEMLPLEEATLATRKRIADMYLKHFKKTTILSLTQDAEILEYNIGEGEGSRVGMRRDGIGSKKYMDDWETSKKYGHIKKIPEIWKYKPIVFEWINNYRMLKHWTDFKFSVDWMLDNHVNLINDGPLRPWLVDRSEHLEQIRRLDKFAGARLVLRSANVDVEDGLLKINIIGVNKGAGRIILPYEIVYDVIESPEAVENRVRTEKQSHYKIGEERVLATFKSTTDPRKILPGGIDIKDSFKLSLPAGKYKLRLTIKSTFGGYRNFRPAVMEADNYTGELMLGCFEVK